MTDEDESPHLAHQIADSDAAIPPHDARRIAERAIQRVRGWIGARDVLYFATLGFLYSRSERSARRGDGDEDASR